MSILVLRLRLRRRSFQRLLSSSTTYSLESLSLHWYHLLPERYARFLLLHVYSPGKRGTVKRRWHLNACKIPNARLRALNLGELTAGRQAGERVYHYKLGVLHRKNLRDTFFQYNVLKELIYILFSYTVFSRSYLFIGITYCLVYWVLERGLYYFWQNNFIIPKVFVDKWFYPI